MPDGLFVDLDSATLLQMKADWTACLQSIAVANQSYSIAGRQFTRANLSEVAKMVAEIGFAISAQSGSRRVRTVADMSQT